ncbi:MAG: TRAP transporter substrate-binding protein DctP [Clostridia bacterium]
MIEKKSNGKIKIEIYPVGQIGDATLQAELLQTGGIEFAMVSPGNTGTIVPENQLFSLHFLFSDNMDKNAEIFKTSKALNETLSNIYLDKNIKVLAYWTEGAMQWTTSRAVNTPAMWKGLKMRTMPSPMIVAAYQAYGANPTPVPYMEVYSGLQLKMIEGQENPLFAIQAELNGAALGKIKEKSNIAIAELTPEEREAFRAASKSAYDEYVKMVGPKGEEILKQLQAEVKVIESK